MHEGLEGSAGPVMFADGAIPTDLGPYAILVALLIVCFVGFAIGVRWLDLRAKEIRAEFEGRIAHLEAQVLKLEGCHGASRNLIVEAIGMLPPEHRDVIDKLIKASAALD